MKLITTILTATVAVTHLVTARILPTASLNATNIANVHLANDAIQTMQNHSIWVPNVANLTAIASSLNGNFTQLSVYLNSIVNMQEEVNKYNASGLDMNDLLTITPKVNVTEGGSIKDPPNSWGVDCAHCHLCEEACIATIWFPPFLWLCEGLCQLQSWCHHCD